MNKNALAVVGVVALLVGGGLIYSIAGDSSDDPAPASTASAGTETGSGTAGSTGAGKASRAPGQYVDYSPELVASTPGTKLLFFHAPWCSQCQALESDINASEIPDGVTIFKVDYDTNQDLRVKYDVTIQTTIVRVDDQGDKLDDLVAFDEPTFDLVEQGLLQ